MSYRWPQPDTEQAFEQLCLEVLKVEWKCPTLELYAKRGERQYVRLSTTYQAESPDGLRGV